MRLLVTDILYPNRYGTWRNVMIEYLLANADTDILVFKNKKFPYGSQDFSFCNRNGLLNGYKIHTNGSSLSRNRYLISKRNTFQNYDAVYHIFNKCFTTFNEDFKMLNIPIDRQFIHLYPGSGYMFSKKSIPSNVNLISTHPETTELYSEYNAIECLFGVHVHSIDQIVSRDFYDRQDMKVCFSSVGYSEYKGDLTYHKIVELYKEKYPHDNVQFLSVGNCMPHPNIKNYGVMDYISLWDFYKSNVDIYVSCETGKAANGWPLGLEAAVTGALLLTTDYRNTGEKIKDLPLHSITTCQNPEEFVASIHQLYIDREHANLCSINTQYFLKKYISPENQQVKILNFMKSALT